MPSHAETALRSYLVPLLSARALKITLILGVVFLLLAGLAVLIKPLSEFFSDTSLERLRRMVIVPGVPLIALLLAEIPIRDGIRHRTLLYALLGPVPRITLAVARTLATAVVLALAASFLAVVVRLMQGTGLGSVGREVLAIWLGAATYISFFGVVHLITRRGLIGGLAIYGVDSVLGQFPFDLRNLSPSYHMSVLADQMVEINLPVALAPPESSMLISSLILIALTALFTLLVAVLFARKRLPELC